MSERIPNQDYVAYYDPALPHHRRWLLAVLDELTVRDPRALSEGRLRDFWVGPKAPPPPTETLSPRQRAWLKVVRHAEGTDRPDGYEITFGYLRRIDTSKPHTGIVNRASGYASDAAGAYQFLFKTWKDIHGGTNPPMTPANQDRAALALMVRRGVDPATAQFTPATVAKLAPEWASLPALNGKSCYGQPVKKLAELKKVFEDELGEAEGPAQLPAAAPKGEERSTLDHAGPHEKGQRGPKIAAPMQQDDHYLLVNGRAGTIRAYDHTGNFLWVAPALCRGQTRSSAARGGDTPPGLYRVGRIYRDYDDDPSATFTEDRRSYGWYSLDLVEMENQERAVGRAGIMIHGGGTAAGWPGAWAPEQPLHSTLGCVRMKNIDLRDKVMPLASKGALYVGVYQP